jgi:hypothetical protein
MQEMILENLVKWFSNLDFSLTKQNNKLSLTCKELDIKIENLSREEFIATVIEQGITGVEKLFNLKVLGIDLRELFGVKKQKVKKEEAKAKEPVSNFEKWIKEELEKAHKNGEFGKVKDPVKNMQDLLEYWKTQKYYFPDYRLEFPKFPWNEIICLVNE